MSKYVSAIAPIALSVLAPGVGTALGAGLGLTGSVGSAVGSGLLGAGLGAGTSAISGGDSNDILRGGLIGGAAGGLSGGMGSSGWVNPDTGAIASNTGSGILGALGQAAPQTMGALTSATRGVTGALGGGAQALSGGSGGGFSPLAAGIQLVGGSLERNAIDEATAQRMAALNAAEQNIGGFTPDDYMNSPAYQFQLEQGQLAMDRANAARGGFYSGGALREAQEFGQGLGSSFYEPAYGRFAGEQGARRGINLARGQAASEGTIAGQNTLSRGLSNVFGSAF